MESNPETSPSLPLPYAVPKNQESRWGKGFLAACGTFVVWGLGQIIAGHRKRGLLWFAAWLLFGAAEVIAFTRPSLVPALLVLLPLQLIVLLIVVIDAFIMGRRSTLLMLSAPIWRYLGGLGLLIVGFLLSSALGHALKAVETRAGANSFVITTASMQPTLLPHDRILTHRTGTLHRWDLVVFHPPGREDIFTQRIVGLPGEKVEIVPGRIQINGVPITAPPTLGPYTSKVAYGPRTGCEGHPIQLKADEFYLLGDNTSKAYDSRYWPDAAPGHQVGAVSRESIIGRVTAIYFPLGRLHQFK